MTLLKSAGNFGMPPQELFAALGALGEELQATGVLVETAGLAPTAASPLVKLADDTITVTNGFEGAGTVDAYAIYEVESIDDAVKLAQSFLEIHQKYWPAWSGEVEVRQTFGG